MLLNYLYQNYLERADFCVAANISEQALVLLEAKSLVPRPSYILAVGLQAKSFIAKHDEQAEYNFYRKDQLKWVTQIRHAEITTKDAARRLFYAQYNAAIVDFKASEIGKEIIKIYPPLEWKLSDYAETWRHFTIGTYGLCTRTGLPREIFLKHIYIRFIEYVTAANRPENIPQNLKALLLAVVDDLDINIESDFAPHEIQKSSRQRCIIDVRKDYQT